MPTVSLLFNSATVVGDCIFTQFSYLLNIQKRIWDDGGALVGVREKTEAWADQGIGAGLFVADAQKPKGKSKSAHTSQPVLLQDESAYYTKRGGKYIRGLNDPANPLYLEAQAQKQLEGRRQHTDSNNQVARKPSRGKTMARKNTPLSDTLFRRGAHHLEYSDDDDDWANEQFEIDTFNPRMLVRNKPRELAEYEGDFLLVRETMNEMQQFAEATKSPGPAARKGISSEKLSVAQKRMSVFGAGQRGAALLLASPRGNEEELLSADAIEYSATETEAYITLSDELSADVVFHDPGQGVPARKAEPPNVLPSAIIKAAREEEDEDDDDADVAHAHFSDKKHFDMTDKQRKAVQQQMHRRRHRMGRRDKENKQLLDLGASGVVSDAFRHAKIAQQRDIQAKANVLSLGVNRQATFPKPSLLGRGAAVHNQHPGAASAADYVAVPKFVPVRPADVPPSKQAPANLRRLSSG